MKSEVPSQGGNMSRIKAHIVYAALLALFLVTPLFAAPDPQQNIEQNKAVARKLFEVALNQDNWEVYDEIHSKDFVAHSGKLTIGLAEDLQDAKGWRQAFPDGRYSINHVVAEGDFVVVHFTGRGTNTGAWNDLPATGKPVEVVAITIFRIVGGKIVEEWTEYNKLSLLRQLGLAPASSH
jgi:steroid delta-isomerase-like uncharacterized protein